MPDTMPVPVSLVVAVLVGLFALAGYLVVRPRMLRWGATPAEAGRAMAGDDLIADPIMVTTRAITVAVEPERVWPWLAQMGQGRGGFYSYEWLENLAGFDIHNSDRVIPELQNLKPGDLIPFWRGAGVNVVTVKPGRLLVLAGTLNPPKGKAAVGGGGNDVGGGGGEVGGTWVFALEEHESWTTRLVVRARVAEFRPAWLSAFFMRVLEPLHFVMERKMLRGIRSRAEGNRPGE